MKLNIKDNLKKFYLISEGWADELERNYSEDILIFVGRMLQIAYPNEDISNHPLAKWIADSSKKLGELPWSEPHKTTNEQAYQTILNFVREKKEDNDIVSKIKTLNPKDALKFVKEESEKQSLTGEEELKDWIDKGYLRIVGKGPKGSFWVTPLKGEFFGVAQCGRLTSMQTHTQGEFGIGCQKGLIGGAGAEGIGSNVVNTYTLLAKARNGYYTGLISYAGNVNDGNFVGDMASFGNVVIGSQTSSHFPNWSKKDILNAFVDFMIENPEGKKIYKYPAIIEGEVLPSRAFGELTKEEHRDIFYRLLRKKPEFVEFYEPALKRLLGEEEFSLLTIKARELYEKNPKDFISKLPTYLKTEKEEALKILSEINFEEFIDRYGEDVILNNIDSILSSMDYNKFQNLIKPYINYDRFIEKTDKKTIKEIIRNFSEKAQNAKATLPMVNSFIESERDFKALLKNFGNGDIEKGLTVFLNSLSTPRMSKHNNYLKTPKGVFADVEKVVFKDFDGIKKRVHSNGNVLLDPTTNEVYDESGNLLDFGGDNARKFAYIESNQMTSVENVEIKEGQWILDYKSIRNLLKQNKDVIVNLLGGGKKGEVKFVEQIIRNSSLQDRERELKNILDDYIAIYDNLYKEKKSDVPGIIQYTKVLNFLLPSESYKQDMIDEISKSYEEKFAVIYKIDKQLVEFDKNKQKLLSFYATKSKGSESEKLLNTFTAYIQTLTFSNSSVMKIEEETKKAINFLLKKGVNTSEVLQFLINVLEIIPTEFLSSLRGFVESDILSSSSNFGIKVKKEKEGYNPATGERKPNIEVIEKVKKINNLLKADNEINESKIRKYIQKLLENNFNIK